MKILIVDDEPGVARRLAEGVETAGCGECFAATSAEEAVEIVNREGSLDVLVAHVVMEGIDGFTLYETLLPHLPDLHAIFLSEYDVPANADRSGGWPILPRSVEPGALVFAIQHLTPPAPSAPPPAPVEEIPDPLVGTVLGNYRIEALLGADLDGNFYRAVQTNISRGVELHALSPERAADPSEVARFLADARTKANVHHPALLSVFEAGEVDGIYFYTSEPRNGSSLGELSAQGMQLESRTIFQLLHSVAEVMVHIAHEKTAHELLKPAHVIVDHRMRTRLVNIATSEPSGAGAVEEMRSLAMMIEPVVTISETSGSLQQLLFEMSSDSVTLRSWNALLYEVKRGVSGGASPHSHRLDASGRAAIEAVGAARKRQRRVRLALILGAIVLLLGGAGVWAWKTFSADFGFGPREGDPALETMVLIPAGDFTFSDGRKVTLPDFWIDTHEVTIGQYADFLAWTRSHPGQAREIAPAVTPEGHSYVPAGWDDSKTATGVQPGYHAIARVGGVYQGSPLTLDSPVFGVDWFDACAYAVWKGRRLPTDEEWEKAALGTAGKKYPWGDEWKPGDANIAAKDKKWVGVAAMPADRSPTGVIGTGGNVSEWTLTVAGEAGGMKPIVRGGNWSDRELDIRRRQHDLEASQNAPTVGFRTASDKSPQPKP